MALKSNGKGESLAAWAGRLAAWTTVVLLVSAFVALCIRGLAVALGLW